MTALSGATLSGATLSGATLSGVTLAGLALAGAITVAWAGFHGHQLGDYPRLFATPMNALLAGHVTTFLTTLPPDGAGGSVLLRAPAAILGKLFDNDQLTIYRAGALACLLVSAGVGVVLAARAARNDRPWYDQLLLVGIFVLAPAVLRTIWFGHPEEDLGAALCIAAVLLAAKGRPTLAGAALGVAVLNKPWALLAAPPVLLALRGNHRRAIATAGAITGAWAAAILLGSPHDFARSIAGAGDASIAHPDELWWPLAHWGTWTINSPLWREIWGTQPYTGALAPGAIAHLAHPLTLVLAVAAAIPLARRRPVPAGRVLALLAVVFGLRCLLDPSDYIYYQVPFVLSLAAWEAVSGRTPVLAAGATAGMWLVFNRIDSTHLEYVGYLAIVLPLLAGLAVVAAGRTGGPAERAITVPGYRPAG